MAIQQVDKGTIRQQPEEDESRIGQQIAAGKKITGENMNLLSKEFNRSDINEFSFDASHADFDYDRISILDMNRRVVMKVSEEEMSNIPSLSTPEVRHRFEARLRAAVINHYNLSIPN